MRKALKEVTRRRDDLFREAFGKKSLFPENERGSDSRLAAWEAFSAESLAEAGDGCPIGGLFRDGGGQSYVLVLLQCLLRIPLLQRLLRGHCARCGVGDGDCASCAHVI